ncbi:MAG TPA: hypothetical protein VFB22_05690 [Candidatus Baltobacteraceae bacterium]|nr:hypothetical protein [Candidatus Baltobacteraceae bacterium]
MTFPLFFGCRPSLLDDPEFRAKRIPRDSAGDAEDVIADIPDRALWVQYGFTEDEARAWRAAATPRFTPFTASTWRFEGFGPNDAALWSEVYCDPMLARQRRSRGYADPFDAD